ncbi:MAG: hypothetical protein Q9214_004915, partial [Letrouitia sp. 1 TL-2023]
VPPQGLIETIKEVLRHEVEQFKDPEFTEFANETIVALDKSLISQRSIPPIVDSLRNAYLRPHEGDLKQQIKTEYRDYLLNHDSSKTRQVDDTKIADLRFPTEWFPNTREMQRSIHLHVGPTNSGKTYQALKRLEQAESGIYAGPLRLLAHEVFTRLNNRGKACHLITGDERIAAEGDDVRMSSCTVEMVPVDSVVEVAVIDEIQMIGDKERGWAWTEAVLGLRAKELHLCGEERSVPLIRELAAAMGDELRIHCYERLSPLQPQSQSVGHIKRLKKGDCVVAFSEMAIHSLKAEIQRLLKKPVAVVYGNLPPEIRAQQAALFNDPNNEYDILVASDAVGMGLNLNIKRIVFSTTAKWNGNTHVPVPMNQIKQIAGRAGRFRTVAQAVENKTLAEGLDAAKAASITTSPTATPPKTLGLVTTLESKDLKYIHKSMNADPEPIMTAGVFPPVDVLLRFAAYFPPSTPFSYILLRLHRNSLVHHRFHLCALKDHVGIADIIESVENLSLGDRFTFCVAPASISDQRLVPVIKAYARCVGHHSGGALLDIKELDLELLNRQVNVGSRIYLENLESLHKALILYLWLSYRFAGVFTSQAMAFYVKNLVEDRIQSLLGQISAKDGTGDLKKKSQQAMLRKLIAEQPGVSTMIPDQEADPLSSKSQRTGHESHPFIRRQKSESERHFPVESPHIPPQHAYGAVLNDL